jgi:LuxR family transcriptional regulator, quorum-sensing system regulator SdiA
MNIQPSSPRRQRAQTNSSNLSGWGWREKDPANSLAGYSVYGRDAHPLSLMKTVRDFVANLEKASSLNRAMDLLGEAVEQLGYLRVIYSWMPATRLADGRWAPPPLIWRNLPPRWERQWPRHSPNDPYYHACFENNLSVEWSTIQGRNCLSSAEQDSWTYLADNQMSRGLTIPIRMPVGRFAYVSALDCARCDEWAGVVDRSREVLFIIAHHFNQTILRKFGNPFPHYRVADLSARELECLTSAAKGKNAQDIACIIDRSVETVRVHLKRACSKLGATNRTHAAAKAVFLGMIECP